uniref:KH domain-containing protein At4g18375 n=2 Tax=Anthurium amnicola TaxID=1678845 RepID=A0A1D1XQW8_9ARAE
MGETGKRYRNARENDDRDGKSQNKRQNNKENPNNGELVVYRILCPDNVIGSVIGKGGKVINSLRQETHAKIKVVDPFPGANERVITIYCYVNEKDHMDVDEDDLEPLCPAQDALLKVHATIVNALANLGDSDKKRKEEARILVPASQTATIIGKSGATIKKLRSNTKANIKVIQKDPDDPTHACAMSFDNFVSVSGDEEAVKKALFAVSAIMYKFSPKEEISLDTTVQELPPSIIIPSDVPIFHAGGIFPTADAITPTPRSVPPVLGTTTNVPELHGYTDKVGTWSGYPSTFPIVSTYGGPSRSEELVVRVLCPSDKIGRVIGKGGSSIKYVRQASGAGVDIDDAKNESEERVITVTSTECADDQKSAAVEAVLLLQGKINDDDNETVVFRLLVPSKVIGCLIGKNGSIVNDMRKKTKATIRISKGEKPKCAGSDDELVEVQGEVSCVRDALVQIVLRLRDDALKDRDSGKTAHPVDSLYSSGHSVPSVLPSVPAVVPPASHLGYDQTVEAGTGLGVISSSSLYGFGSLQGGDNGYGHLPSYSSKPYGGLPSFIEMVIPANAVGKVMGKVGTNLANIRKISGANIDVVESKVSRGERIAQISGTTEQKRTAENLIQAFIMAS